MADEEGDIQERLDRRLEKIREGKRKAAEEEARRIEEPKRFAQTFHAVAAAKIMPVLEKARTPFVKHDVESSVVQQYDMDPPLILLEVALRGVSRLIYTAIMETREIRVSQSFSQYTGAGKEVDRIGLNDITREIVQSQVDEFLEAALGKGGS